MGREIEKTTEQQLLDIMSTLLQRANDKMAAKSNTRQSSNRQQREISTEKLVHIIRSNAGVFQSLIEQLASGADADYISLPNVSLYHQNQPRTVVITDPGMAMDAELDDEMANLEYFPPPSSSRLQRRNAVVLNPESMGLFWQNYGRIDLDRGPPVRDGIYQVLRPPQQQSNRHQVRNYQLDRESSLSPSNLEDRTAR